MFEKYKHLRASNNPYIIFYGILLITALVLYLLYDNQFNKGVDRSVGLILPFQSVGDRGDIFFTDKDGGRNLVATTTFGYNLNISPAELGDAEEIYEHLNEVIPIEREVFFRSASKEEGDQYEILKKNLPEKKKDELQDRINEYGLKGVWLEPFRKREYPYRSLGAHIIGFVSVDRDNKTRGQYGIENIYDDVLSGTNKLVKPTIATVLEQVGEGQEQTGSSILAGNVLLTIDIDAQRKLEEQIEDIQKRWRAKKVGGIVIDPSSGLIIAMGSIPKFDPNNFGEVRDYSVFNNPAVEEVYEMGSVFKALTAAIALDSGKVSINDTYNDRGSVVVGGKVISNFDKRGRGANTSLQTILSQSLNTGAVFLQQKTGMGTYKDYIDEFRFDSTTQIDLPKEIPGLVENLNTNRAIEFATASFGQGIAVTPMAATRAFASLANGGFIVQPFVTKEVERPRIGGIISGGSYTRERKRVFNNSSVKKVTEMLVNAYDRSLLGGTFRNPRHSIAAKTGTAQLVDPVTGKYAEGEVVHTFFGYFPSKSPQFLIFLYAVSPQAEYAATTLTAPFSTLSNFLITHYAIPPDR